MSIEVTPTPTEEELAAILAAYESLWPRPDTGAAPDPAPRWRYSGRSWITRPRYGGWT
jgi:hypothetical protein